MIGVLLAAVLFLPEADLDIYLSEPVPPVKCADDMLDYPTMLLPFDEPQTMFLPPGSRLDALDIQPGYLVSECELLRLMNAKIELDRLKLDLQTIRELRTREFELWRMTALEYQHEIDQLTKDSWWRRNKLLVGVLSGVAGTVAMTALTYSLLR